MRCSSAILPALIGALALLLIAGTVEALDGDFEEGPNELLYVEQGEESLQVLIQRFVRPNVDGYDQTVWLPRANITPTLKLESSRYTQASPAFADVAAPTANSTGEFREFRIELNKTGLVFGPGDHVRIQLSFGHEGHRYTHKASAALDAFRIVAQPLPGSQPSVDGEVPELRLDEVRPRARTYSWPVLPHVPLSEASEVTLSFSVTGEPVQQHEDGDSWLAFAAGAGSALGGVLAVGYLRRAGTR